MTPVCNVARAIRFFIEFLAATYCLWVIDKIRPVDTAV